MIVPAPTAHPSRRPAADIARTLNYQQDDLVWVYREGAWRPGIIESASEIAVMATYKRADGRGTGVDTLRPQDVSPRLEADEEFDLAARQGQQLTPRVRMVEPRSSTPPFPSSVNLPVDGMGK